MRVAQWDSDLGRRLFRGQTGSFKLCDRGPLSKKKTTVVDGCSIMRVEFISEFRFRVYLDERKFKARILSFPGEGNLCQLTRGTSYSERNLAMVS